MPLDQQSEVDFVGIESDIEDMPSLGGTLRGRDTRSGFDDLSSYVNQGPCEIDK